MSDPDDLAAVRAEGRRLLAAATEGPWHQMAAAAWSGTNEDPNLVADCPLYADAIAIVWLRNNADALLADPAPVGLTEQERKEQQVHDPPACSGDRPMSDISDGHVLIDGTVYRVVFEVRGQPLPDGGRFPLPVDLYRLVPVAGGTGSFTPVSPSVDPEEG